MTNEHDEDENPAKTKYKLGNKASIFYDPGQKDGKVLVGQVVELDNTERVLAAVQTGHLVVATSGDEKKAQKLQKEAEEELASRTAATATAAPAGAATGEFAKIISEAQTAGTMFIEDAKEKAGTIVTDAEAEAEQVKSAAETEAARIKEQAEKEAKEKADKIVKDAKAEAARITGEAKQGGAK